MEQHRVRVLLIEDDPDYTMLMNVYVNEACGDALKYVLESASSLQSGLDLLTRQEFDIALLDLMLPDSRGLETLDRVRAKAPSLPVVVLTNLDQEELGVEAIARGAQDFLPKSRIDSARLRHAIGFALARNRVFRQMELLVDGSPDALVIVDRERMVRYANAAALKLFGLERERMVGRLFEHQLSPGKAVELKLPGVEGGPERPAEMRAAEIEWRSEPAWLASIRDVSELKKLEQIRAEVKERRRMDQMKDQLLSTVAHELRTPLSVIKAVVGTLRDRLAGPMTADQIELVVTADRHINRLSRLLNNFLDLSRLESRRSRVNRKPIDPVVLLREVCDGVRMANRGRSTVLLFDIPEAMTPVLADEDMVAQVIGNLLDNALRYARARVLIKAVENNGEVEISVTDDGPGIPPARVAELFDKFVQLDRPKGGSGYKGTGLGLAICKEIIQLNSGRIWADNAPGWGASFHFTLPIAQAGETGHGKGGLHASDRS